MAFNRQNYIKVKEMYDSKYLIAEAAADRRREEIHALIPEVADIDRELSKLGLKLLSIMTDGGENASASIEELRASNDELLRMRNLCLINNGYPKDYTDVRYECEKCGDTGYVGTTMCECMRKELIKLGYESAGISAFADEYSFDGFSLDYYRTSPEHYERMSSVYEIARSYAESFTKKSGNLLLVGGTGLGKTYLSVCIAKTAVERGYDVVYSPASEMISEFEARRFGKENNGSEVDTSKYLTCDLLIIDDLGTEISNQFTSSCIYNIINGRLCTASPTVISTNLVSGELRTRYWDRITSRIFGEYRVLAFLGKDVRLQKLSENN